MSTLISSRHLAGASTPPTPSLSLPQAPRALVTFLLAASVAALAVLADRFMGTWADGHLLAAWMLMWGVVFAGSLLLTHPARRLAQQLMQWLNAWAARHAQARAEARLLALARTDPRLQADLHALRSRTEGAGAAPCSRSIPCYYV